MARTTTNVTIRLDKDLKETASDFFEGLGMSLSTAINIFIRKCMMEDRIPFDIGYGQPNKKLMEAMLEAERIAKDPNAKTYSDVEELIADLNRDDDDEDE